MGLDDDDDEDEEEEDTDKKKLKKKLQVGREAGLFGWGRLGWFRVTGAGDGGGDRPLGERGQGERLGCWGCGGERAIRPIYAGFLSVHRLPPQHLPVLLFFLPMAAPCLHHSLTRQAADEGEEDEDGSGAGGEEDEEAAEDGRGGDDGDEDVDLDLMAGSLIAGTGAAHGGQDGAARKRAPTPPPGGASAAGKKRGATPPPGGPGAGAGGGAAGAAKRKADGATDQVRAGGVGLLGLGQGGLGLLGLGQAGCQAEGGGQAQAWGNASPRACTWAWQHGLADVSLCSQWCMGCCSILKSVCRLHLEGKGLEEAGLGDSALCGVAAAGRRGGG